MKILKQIGKHLKKIAKQERADARRKEYLKSLQRAKKARSKGVDVIFM
jgi:uncharacterized protein (DUF58 family)